MCSSQPVTFCVWLGIKVHNVLVSGDQQGISVPQSIYFLKKKEMRPQDFAFKTTTSQSNPAGGYYSDLRQKGGIP